MTKIIARVPLPEAYSYVELHFDSIEEYKKDYPLAAQAVKETRAKLRNDEPFHS